MVNNWDDNHKFGYFVLSLKLIEKSEGNKALEILQNKCFSKYSSGSE